MADGHNDDDWPNDQSVNEKVEEWGIGYLPDAMERARQWLRHVAVNSYYATAFMVPYVIAGINGMIVACSTAESTRMQNQNNQEQAEGMPIRDPSFLYFNVYWFPRMAILNFVGITKAKFQGSMIADHLGDF